MTAIYVLKDGKLSTGAYIHANNHVDQKKYVEDFRRMADILTEKYGKPCVDTTIFTDDLYKGRPELLGNAIATGGAKMIAELRTGKACIHMAKDAKVEVSLLYRADMNAEEANSNKRKDANNSKDGF